MTHSIKTGCLPYDDGSGFKINIDIEPPNKYFNYYRLVLNSNSEFTDFDIEDWPAIKDAIDRAINSHKQLTKQ